MSISFSGLSSGIDTSSWVESLVALRQAKVTKLEEEKESVVSIQDVLSNIKSFFTSFRSTLEKVTDAKFGIASMDLFAQNLATSSDINVVTGTATTEAEEATYNIQVDKLASSTEAASNQNFTTTVIETATATLGTKLSDIGVKTGQIGVTSNGNQYKISITEEDTIKSLIDKLQAVGVDANYNEKTGIFSANIDASDIDDSISNTGIVDAFHLSDSVGGYGSGKLETSDTDTLVTTATGSTKLRMLGVEAGTLTMEANGAEYSFQVTDKTTIQEFVDAMKSVNIDASFNNGVLSIVDAEITDEGTTNIISALGLETKVNQNTQTSGGLSYTEVKTAGLNDKITEFISGSSGVVNVYDKTGVQLGSVTISDSTTFEGFFDRLEDYGIKGRLEDGVISFSSSNGNYMTGKLMDKLGVGVVTTTITTTSGSGVSSGGSVSYDTVKDETTTDYTTTTTTTTSTSTSGMGMTSDTTIDYSTVRLEETIVTYETVITTTTLTTLTSGGSDGKIIETTVLYSTINALSTTTVVTTIGTMTTTTTTTVTQSFGTRPFCNEINRIDVSRYQALSSVSTPASTLAAGTYAINTAADLKRLAEWTNQGYIVSGNTFIMGADIDLSGVNNWTPIGNTASRSFKGNFNGNGYEVQNLRISGGDYANGLFGYMDGDVKFLGITGLNIDNCTADNVGGLVGVLGANKTINNCYVRGSITSKSSDYVGGLVGKMSSDSVIKYSNVNITISNNTTSSSYYGGLVGIAIGSIVVQNSYAKGAISQTSGYRYGCIGGLIGTNDSSTRGSQSILSCFTDMSIASNTYMGGLYGRVIGNDDYYSTIIISDTKAGGTITNYEQSSYGTICASGMIGLVEAAWTGNDSYRGAYVSIINSTTAVNFNINSTNSSTSSNDFYVGGVIARQLGGDYGTNYAYITIDGYVFTGNINVNVNGAKELAVGGICGTTDVGITVSNAHINGTISAAAASGYEHLEAYAGGIFGCFSIRSSATITSCLVDGSVSLSVERGTVYAGGTAGYTKGYSDTYTSYVTYTSVISNASVSALTNGGNAFAGGLFGNSSYYVQVYTGQSNGNVTATAAKYGTGYNSGGSAYAGGTSAYSVNLNRYISVISSLTSSGSINATGTDAGYAGGLFGYASVDNVSLIQSYTTGCVYGSSHAGGLIGNSSSYSMTISGCYTSGIITGGDAAITGGLIGTGGSTVIKDSKVLGYSPTVSGIFIGNSGSNSSRIENSQYNTNFEISGTNIFGNNNGTSTSVTTCGTSVPFTNSSIKVNAAGASAKSEANSEISQIISIDVSTNTIFETSTAIDVKTETIKSTATITSTSSEIQYKYTTISGEFMNAITRIDTVNMTSLSDIKALNGALESGTYAIRTTEDLKLLQNWSNFGFLTGNYYFVLGDNINLMNQSWTPIAYSNSSRLNATFDGNGYEISNLSIKGSYENAGLFGMITEVKNLGLRNVIVNNTNSNGNTGAIAGNCTNVTNCYVTGSGSVTGCFNTGGLVGVGEKMTSCYSDINVIGNGTHVVTATGGLMGSIYSGATIAYCYTTGNVTAKIGNVGLFIGDELLAIKSSYATGTLTKDGTVVNGFFIDMHDSSVLTSLKYSSFYKNTSGKYVFNGSNLSSMPYNYNTKQDIVDVRAPYKVLFSTTYTASGTDGSIVTTNITTKTETIVETQTLPVTSSVAMTAETTFSQLGMTSDNETISGVYNGKAFTLTITSADTVGDIASALGDYGITATVRGGRIYINDSENAYITNISSAVKNALGITASMGNGSSYTVTTHTTVTTNTIASQTTIHVTSTVQMSEETKFSEIGMNSDNEYIKGSYNGKNFSIAVTRSDTVGDIIEALADYGINASVRGGKIYINESENAYITSFSNGIKNALAISASGGSGSTYTITTIKTYANTAPTNNVLGKVTVTSAVTRDTELSDLGVTTGEYNIWNNGVKYTALISSDETVGSLLDTLAQFGIQASIVNNGNTSTIRLTGNGNAYVAKSASINNASNVVDILFPSANKTTTYNYNGNLQIYSTVTTHTTATEDTLLSEFDTPWGNTTLKNAGILALEVNGESRNITITENDTFGTLIDKLQEAGAEAALIGGRLYISSANNLSINTAASTSALVNPNAAIKLTKTASIDDFTASDSAIVETETIIEEHTGSAASYANLDTKLGLLNISSGTISIYKNGVKATINVNEDQTFSDLRAQISAKFSDVDLSFEDGYLVLKSSDKDAELDFGSTTDTSNFLAITGLKKDKDDKTRVTSARQLYCVNADSKVTEAGLFKKGDVTAGTFFVGDQKFTIDENTTISDIISMINSSEDSNATAYWDSINAQLVIKSRTTGAALINIEAGTSNFTDILGFTQSEWNADGTLKSTKLKVDSQTLGSNAEFRINGTSFTATSNTIGSDISRIKGVTIDLKGLTEGSAVTLTVERDKESLASAISDVVDSYNELMTNVDKELAVDGSLHSESMLKLIRNRLRSIMTSSDAGAAVFRNLNQIGITTDKASAGSISTSNITKLTFDKDKFFDALKADEDAVKALIIGGTDNTGIFTKVEELLEDALRSVSGYFDSTANSLQNKAKRIDKKIAAENTAIEKYKARLENKFNSMDMLIGQMQNQYSSFLGS